MKITILKNTISAELKAAETRLARSLGAGVYAALGNVMATAIPYTPLAPDGGTLRGSAYVTLPVVDGKHVSSEAGFGGSAKEYAAPVHERTGPTAWSEPGTGPKFLERAWDEHRATITRDVGAFAKANSAAGSPEATTGSLPTSPK